MFRRNQLGLFLPLIILSWLVTMGSMCPSGSPVDGGGGRGATASAYMDITPAMPLPGRDIEFFVSSLVLEGNPDAYAAWQIVIFSGIISPSQLSQEFSPGDGPVVKVLSLEDPIGPGETLSTRITDLPAGRYTVGFYVSASSIAASTTHRADFRPLVVGDCNPVRLAGFPNTLTLGVGPNFRNLPDTGNPVSPRPISSDFPHVLHVDEPLNWVFAGLVTGGSPPIDFELVDSDINTGLSISPEGIITGTPPESAAGLHWIEIKLQDRCQGSARYQIARVPISIQSPFCPALTSGPASLADPVLGRPYSATLTSTGGTGAVNFALTSGTLPAGLTLSGTTISGTPTAIGAATFTIRATDSCTLDDPRTADRTYTLTVLDPASCPALDLGFLGSFAEGRVGTAYSVSIPIIGGLPPVTATLASGNLPPGISISSDGTMLIGTPTSAGRFDFTLQATDTCDPAQTTTEPYGITVVPAAPSCPAFSGQTSLMPAGSVGVAYAGSVATSGGQGAVTATISAGALPPGLMLTGTSGNFQVTGTPTTEGTFNFTVQAMDSCVPPQVVTMPLMIVVSTVVECLTPPSLSITGLPSGSVGTPYSVGLTANGGTGAVLFDISAGALPDGLTISPSGAISGIPALGGTFNFTVRVTDSCVPPQSGQQATSITIIGGSSCPPITGDLAPVLEDATVGEFYQHSFDSGGGQGILGFSWLPGSEIPPGLTLETSEGVLFGTPTTPGTYSFAVVVFDECDPPQNFTILTTLTVN